MRTIRGKTMLAIAVMSLLGLAQQGFSQGRAPAKIQIGDMIFEEGQFEIENDDENDAVEQKRALQVHGLAARSFVRRGTNPWPNGRLPIEFASGITREQKQFFFSACQEWSLRSNVRCVADAKANVRIRVVKGDGCSSEVGYGSDNIIGAILPGKRKDVRRLSLGDGCWSKAIITHELGHALGLTHEHQRPDRDEYIEVLWDNIDSEKSGNFRRFRGGWTFNLPYDFQSIMHYGKYAFSEGGLATWTPRSGYESSARTAGSARVPSVLDGKTVSLIYGAPRLISRGASW